MCFQVDNGTPSNLLMHKLGALGHLTPMRSTLGTLGVLPVSRVGRQGPCSAAALHLKVGFDAQILCHNE